MSKLQIVGTSIGNLEDMTLRALKTLFSSDVVLAEDTRVYLKLKTLLKERHLPLLQALNLDLEKRAELISYRDQNHSKVFPQIMHFLQEDQVVCLVSDSGMPAISDPGFKLISELIDNGFEVETIPGPTAFVSSLLISGLAPDKFTFLGFLPRKTGKAMKLIERYLDDENTVIIYESPFRVLKTLEALKEKFGDDLLVAATTEITKLHEKAYRGKVTEVLAELKKVSIKGEWVICMRVS